MIKVLIETIFKNINNVEKKSIEKTFATKAEAEKFRKESLEEIITTCLTKALGQNE